ncbi:hypothetical protein N7499_004285 [Penicillium canescens]|nr:hypothetical protein N7499_004285 [Penicillium canescens]KAJ6181391.1 hypothetical protein N7485_000033 [Penicillium canescens]
MASRAFSSTARQLKQLNWTLHGTTVDVSWLIQQIESSIDEVPGLRARVASAQVIGNPHPTPNRDDPYHGSVVLLDKDGKRVTSAHAYLNGYVKFSKEATFKPVKLPPMPGAPVIPPEGVATRKSDSTSVSNQSTSEKRKK